MLLFSSSKKGESPRECRGHIEIFICMLYCFLGINCELQGFDIMRKNVSQTMALPCILVQMEPKTQDWKITWLLNDAVTSAVLRVKSFCAYQ